MSAASVAAANPYNPFGRAVTIDYAFPFANINEVDTDFVRAVLGLKGTFGGAWTWELAALHSQDWVDEFDPNYIQNTAAIQTALNSTDPATAFNPFTGGLPVAPQVLATFFSDSGIELESRRETVNGLLRGSLLELPAGAVEWALGGEYAREKQTAPLSLLPIGDRSTAALFAETRIPLLSSRAQERDILALSLAARYDDYSDFGDTTNPQFAAEWRPFDTLLVRGTYAEAFKAPSLDALHRPERTTPANTVRDPVTGQTVVVASRTGGNPALRPEKGESQTFGIVYSSKAMPGFRLSVTHWEVRQTDAIQSLTAQAVIDNEALFPGRVIRNSAGVIQVVDGRLLNFGGIETAGLDYELNYQRQTSLGLWSGSVAATQFDTYDIRLTPGAPPLGQISLANSTNNWAPRWKGTTTLGWQRNDHSVNFVGRYVSRYQDYSSTRQIGDFWVFDVHARSEFGKLLGLEHSLLRRAYIEVGGVNLFDKLPQYSNYSGSLLGYDPSQGDIRGRHLFLQIGTQL